MPSHGSTYLAVSATGPNAFAGTYWRYVRKYSDDQETDFKQRVRMDAVVRSHAAGINEIRLGNVQRKQVEPNGWEV